jgi:hypothetical protein
MEEQNKIDSIFGFAFSSKLKEDMRTAAIWAKIVAVIGFIAAALTFVSNIVAGNIISALLSTAVNVLVNFYLINFANNAKNAVENIDQNDLENGLNNLRLYFKVYGIIVIILLALAFIVFTYLLLYTASF